MRSAAKKTIITRDEMAQIFEAKAHYVSISKIAKDMGYDHSTVARGIRVAEIYGVEACR